MKKARPSALEKEHAEDAPGGAFRQALFQCETVALAGDVWPFLFMVLLVRPRLKLFPLSEHTKCEPITDGTVIPDLTLGIKRFFPWRAFGMKKTSRPPPWRRARLTKSIVPTESQQC